MSTWTAVAGSAAALTAATYGGWQLARAGMQPTSQMFGRCWVDVPDPDPARHTVMITYDDGPSPRNTPTMLDTLAEHNAKATFFVVGEHVRRYPEIARRMLAEGHLIGNHTETHPNLALLSPRRVREEIRRCQQTVQDTLGITPRYFRPPFGARWPHVMRIATELEMVTVLWNATAYDWEKIGPAQMLHFVEKEMGKNRARGRTTSVLLHDGSHKDHEELVDRTDSVRVTGMLLNRPGLRFATVAPPTSAPAAA